MMVLAVEGMATIVKEPGLYPIQSEAALMYGSVVPFRDELKRPPSPGDNTKYLAFPALWKHRASATKLYRLHLN